MDTELNQRFEQVEDRVDTLERQLNSLDTQLNAAEQALAAMRISRKNEQKIDGLHSLLDEKFDLTSRALYKVDKLIQTLICAAAGVVLFWLGHPLVVDAIEINDWIAHALILTGMGFLGYGLLVLTENEKLVLKLIEKINPWSK